MHTYIHTHTHVYVQYIFRHTHIETRHTHTNTRKTRHTHTNTRRHDTRIQTHAGTTHAYKHTQTRHTHTNTRRHQIDLYARIWHVKTCYLKKILIYIYEEISPVVI